MAVKTISSKPDLDQILAGYSLGEIQGFRALKLGAVQTNLLVKTTKTKVVFRYYESRSEKYVLFEINVLRYLKRYKYPCLMPIKSIHGKFIGKYQGKPFALFEFIEGVRRKKPDLKLVVQAIGKLHKITAGHKPKCFQARDTYDPKVLLGECAL